MFCVFCVRCVFCVLWLLGAEEREPDERGVLPLLLGDEERGAELLPAGATIVFLRDDRASIEIA